MAGSWVSVVALLAWLVLAVSAYSGFRFGWRKNMVLALVWATVFTSMTLIITWMGL
ncbi:hypothetical protein [Altererythrobacter fulvus]|uniref:hypothetical protein n=1 Tax=Caenibius fulvus TaxID=2126012 RepID=UPI0030173459